MMAMMLGHHMESHQRKGHYKYNNIHWFWRHKTTLSQAPRLVLKVSLTSILTKIASSAPQSWSSSSMFINL
jgi:hypothetical protein